MLLQTSKDMYCLLIMELLDSGFGINAEVLESMQQVTAHLHASVLDGNGTLQDAVVPRQLG